MDQAIRDSEPARRLARTIVSDIAAYHKDQVEQGVVRDDLFEALAPIIEEGRRHFESKTHPELHGLGLYEKALVDFLLKPFGHVASRIW